MAFNCAVSVINNENSVVIFLFIYLFIYLFILFVIYSKLRIQHSEYWDTLIPKRG